MAGAPAVDIENAKFLKPIANGPVAYSVRVFDAGVTAIIEVTEQYKRPDPASPAVRHSPPYHQSACESQPRFRATVGRLRNAGSRTNHNRHSIVERDALRIGIYETSIRVGVGNR